MQGIEILKEEQYLCLSIKPYFGVKIVSKIKEKNEDFLASLVKLNIATFGKLFYFLSNAKNKIKLEIKLSSTNLISLEQLKILSQLKNIEYKFIIDDSFEFTCFDSTENVYTIDEMIEIKMMMKKILENIPSNLTVDKKYNIYI